MTSEFSTSGFPLRYSQPGFSEPAGYEQSMSVHQVAAGNTRVGDSIKGEKQPELLPSPSPAWE